MIRVSTATQTVEALENGSRAYFLDCVTGDSAHPTDKGTFRIFDKRHPYHSRKYDVDMNYAMFFTKDGKALHQYHGLVPLSIIRTLKSGTDYFGSHGCVRLTENDARTLFQWTPHRTIVVVV